MINTDETTQRLITALLVGNETLRDKLEARKVREPKW